MKKQIGANLLTLRVCNERVVHSAIVVSALAYNSMKWKYESQHRSSLACSSGYELLTNLVEIGYMAMECARSIQRLRF